MANATAVIARTGDFVRNRTDATSWRTYRSYSAAGAAIGTYKQPWGKDKIMRTKTDIAESDANGHGAESVASAASAAAAGASGEFHSFIADIEDLITSMTPLTGEDLARAKARLSERVSAAKESISEVSGEIAHRARKTARDTDHYVHEHPWQAVGIGAALGLLIGVLVARHK